MLILAFDYLLHSYSYSWLWTHTNTCTHGFVLELVLRRFENQVLILVLIILNSYSYSRPCTLTCPWEFVLALRVCYHLPVTPTVMGPFWSQPKQYTLMCPTMVKLLHQWTLSKEGLILTCSNTEVFVKPFVSVLCTALRKSILLLVIFLELKLYKRYLMITVPWKCGKLPHYHCPQKLQASWKMTWKD